MSGSIPTFEYSHTDKDGIAVYAIPPQNRLPSTTPKQEPKGELTPRQLFGIGFCLVASVFIGNSGA